MFSSTNAGRSVDNLSALSSGNRNEFPFHSKGHPRPTSRRSSTASSIHSVGGALDSSTSGRTNPVRELGQNAISTLLQPPIVRTGLQAFSQSSNVVRPPTARDIPPVTLTNITRVDVTEFTPYLTQVGALYEQLRRVRESEEDESIQRRGSRQDDGGIEADGLLSPGPRGPAGRKGSVASLSSLNAADVPPLIRRSSSSYGRKAAQGPPPLSTIPNVYFDDEFRLENPRTFDVVSERSEVIPSDQQALDDKGENGSVTAPRKALATNAILQEKLSWYMDTIEVHLINSISTASTTFFTALGSLKELHSEAAESVQRIKALRLELKALDKEVVSTGLEVVHKRRRQDNLRQLNDAVLQLKQIVDGVAACESLVDDGEADKALENIASLERLIAGERDQVVGDKLGPKLRDLRGASALQGVESDMLILRFRIGKTYETQFANVLLEDLQKHAGSVSSSEILLRWSNSASRSKGGHVRSPSVFPTYLVATEGLKTQLLPSMAGLHRAQHIAMAASAYRESVLREIRSLIRRPLPSSNDDDNESMMSVSTSGGRQLSSQEKSSILARNLRTLDAGDAEELLTTIYISVTETLRRVTTQVKVLLDIASSISEHPNGDGLKSPSIRSPLLSPSRPDRFAPGPSAADLELQDELHKTLDVTNLVGQAVDLANDKIVKVLKVRSEQATSLPLDFFLRYFTLNLYFANECEAISGRSGTSLKTVVNAQIKDFVQKNRDFEMQKLAQGMESDQWNAKDFNDDCVLLLDQILESSTHEPSAWTDRTRLWVPYQETFLTNGEAATADTNGTAKEKEKARTATIDAEKFVLPNSAVLCLEGIGNFLQLITGIPSMTVDIASSLIKYLQLFNSRCTQLILGAGATRSAGLKNITTKHLALASQALSFIITLIPHVREFVRRHVGSGTSVSTTMGEFDKVRRLLQEHQDSIHQKLVDIMSGRASTHARSINALDWDAKKSESPHPYMETLCKETSTLHRVLNKHLPEMSIQMIMGPVFESYEEQLGKAFEDAAPKTKAGQDNMTIDVDFLVTKLGKLDGFADTEDTLKNIIKSKQVKADPSSTPIKADTKSEEDNKPEKSETSPNEAEKEEEKEKSKA